MIREMDGVDRLGGLESEVWGQMTWGTHVNIIAEALKRKNGGFASDISKYDMRLDTKHSLRCADGHAVVKRKRSALSHSASSEGMTRIIFSSSTLII